tara:strand:+ start:2736 stop:3626 length:891 start_codon:yes stop_codon:yes gene_type:complete
MKTKPIIGVSGKMGDGKDMIGEIIQYLYSGADKVNIKFEDWDGQPVWGTVHNDFHIATWEIKKFADELKDTLCRWLGCTRADLESRGFKDTPLGEEWSRYIFEDKYSREEYNTKQEIYDNYTEMYNDEFLEKCIEEIVMTPRKMLQLLGTEAGRQIIHPNIWVNTLFAKYKDNGHYMKDTHPTQDNGWWESDWPNWIITDVRFPNEVSMIKRKGGKVIKVTRPMEHKYLELWRELMNDGETSEDEFINRVKTYDYELYKKLTHDSEISLDGDRDWDHVINNDGTIEELIEKVREIC